MLQRFVLTLLVMGMTSAVVSAEEGAEKKVSLFNGRSLEGWKVIGCEAKVVDGAILIEAGNGILLADRQYGDFILECEWKALHPDFWDSGIYFRCDLPPEGRPWPARYQVNMRKGEEGAMPGVKETITKDLHRPGEWNHYKLTVRGSVASLEFNGKKAWVFDEIEQARGHLMLQAEVPGGGQFLFRNITIVDLDGEGAK